MASSLGLAAHAESVDPVYTLERAIDQALAGNPELSILQARVEQANAQLGEALANFYPQVKAGLSYQHTDNPAQAFAMIIAQRRLDFAKGDGFFNHPGGVDNYRPQVTANYSLFRGGQDYYLSKAAELGVETSELEKSAFRNHLLTNVTAAYYGELAAMAAHKVSIGAAEAVASELKQSKLRYEAGTLLKSEVLSLEVQLAEAKDAEIRAANAIELAQNMLKTLLGLSAGEPFSIADSEAAPPAPPATYEELLDQARTHPELQAAQKRVEIAEQQLSAAQGAHLPRADAFVTYGSDSKDLAFSGNRDNVSAGVTVEVDLFSGFATQERVKKAEHELTAAREAARQTRLRIESQLHRARLNLAEALNRTQVARIAVEAAEEALRQVREQYQAGVVTVTRYIEAEVARDKAHTRHINARYDALRADADLKQARGAWQ